MEKILNIYVGTVNEPISITRLGVWEMSQKIASFQFLDTPTPHTKRKWGGMKKYVAEMFHLLTYFSINQL